MKIIITCGPSSEPIDQVRRITNFSSGELGVMLAESLTEGGFQVVCLKGSGATHPDPASPCKIRRFDTNDDLLSLFQETAGMQDVAAIFHVAALCDYKVKRVSDRQGHECNSAKIASRSGALTIELEPATKVIAKLRDLFPNSFIVGWKYELNGTPQEAMTKVERQFAECRTDACVLNGRAYGDGFLFCHGSSTKAHSNTKSELVNFLTGMLIARLAAKEQAA